MALRGLIAIVAILALPSTVAAKPDRVLEAVKRSLPAGWKISAARNTVVISRAGTVWSLDGNRINGPARSETADERKARITGLGRRVTARLAYRSETRWSKRKWSQARRSNRRVRKRIAALEKKYNLRQRRTRHGKRGPYAASTDAERANLAAYQRERSQLQRTVVALPTCQTSRRSLFFLRSVGESDAFHEIHPETASMELNRVRTLLRRVCLPPPR